MIQREFALLRAVLPEPSTLVPFEPAMQTQIDTTPIRYANVPANDHVSTHTHNKRPVYMAVDYVAEDRERARYCREQASASNQRASEKRRVGYEYQG